MGIWGLCPQWGPGTEPMVRGLEGEAPQKLKAFCCVSSWLLYLLEAIVEMQHLYCTCVNDDRNCTNCTYTVNHKKVALHLCHNIGKFQSIFKIFCTISAVKFFKHAWKIPISPKYRRPTITTLMLRCENETSHFILLYSGGARVFAAWGKRLCCRPRQSNQFCTQRIFSNKISDVGVWTKFWGLLLFPPFLFPLHSLFSAPSHFTPFPSSPWE